MINPFNHSALDHVKQTWARRKKAILVTTSVTVVTAGLLVGGFFAYEYVYAARMYPNVSVAGINVGGLSKEAAAQLVEKRFQSMLDNGLVLELDGKKTAIDLRTSGSTDPDLVYDLLTMNVNNVVEEAYVARRYNNIFTDPLNKLPFTKTNISPDVSLVSDKLTESIRDAYPNVEEPGEPIDFDITFSGDEIDVSILEGVEGNLIDVSSALVELERDTEDLELTSLKLVVSTSDRLVTGDEAESLTEDVEEALSAAPYTLTYITDTQREFSWEASKEDVADWIYPVRDEDGDVEMSIDPLAIKPFIDGIREDIDVDPKNARFLIEDGRVVEFNGSADGVRLNADETSDLLVASFGKEETALEVIVDTVEPEITTGSVNDLGIKEVLGVGTSDFSGSPYNRIENIKHGAAKLNGLLVPPGETMSLVEELKPFTISDGYLPELVIKGDEIKPEVGGGLCQIGTTTFRAVMNAGLEVTERRNHSLVVDYYNDPSNGNPGTDATLYDSSPDFKYTNDTGHYVLLTTEVDVPNRELTFTFWGTNDGRKGSYTPPEILSWTGYGATQYKETPDLPPGVERCQAPHAGATTSFDYVVEYADGTTHEETYTSTYRSLPRICLVGIDPDAPPSDAAAEEGETESTGDEIVDELIVTDVELEEITP